MELGLFEIFLVCLGVSFDVMAASECFGAVLMEIKTKTLLRMAGIFCLYQTAAVVLGNLFSFLPLFRNRAGYSDNMYNVCSIVILIAIGLFLLYKGWKNDDTFEHRSEINFKKVRLTALFTSIDSIFVGFGFAMWKVSLLEIVICLFVVTAFAVVIGVYIGYHMGYEPRKNAYRIGAAALILAAIDVFIRTLIK